MTCRLRTFWRYFRSLLESWCSLLALPFSNFSGHRFWPSQLSQYSLISTAERCDPLWPLNQFGRLLVVAHFCPVKTWAESTPRRWTFGPQLGCRWACESAWSLQLEREGLAWNKPSQTSHRPWKPLAKWAWDQPTNWWTSYRRTLDRTCWSRLHTGQKTSHQLL